MRPQNRKIHSKRQPATNKNYNCIYLSNQHKDVEQRRPAHTKPDFNSHVQTPIKLEFLAAEEIYSCRAQKKLIELSFKSCCT